ncbi:hypothetical protein BGLA2_270032 [Burkholderia gladioli]|nr:hypothetical protein BGLA2_270032 [Burkholderia gladioli]
MSVEVLRQCIKARSMVQRSTDVQHDGSGEIVPRGGRAGPALHCEGQRSPQQ